MFLLLPSNSIAEPSSSKTLDNPKAYRKSTKKLSVILTPIPATAAKSNVPKSAILAWLSSHSHILIPACGPN